MLALTGIFIHSLSPIPMSPATPPYILYAQHGWADEHQAIAALAHSLADPEVLVVTPNLGFLNTWLRIEPLISAVEAVVMQTTTYYPTVPMRVVGHSMGGLIWLEVLARHPEWWSLVESLVLVGSPVGGADLARALDPLQWGIGIARDLGQNRRPLAEAIAAEMPMLTIAGDIDNGSDGTVTRQCTKVFGAEFVCLPGVDHAAMKNHPAVAEAIRQFWTVASRDRPTFEPDPSRRIIQRLQAVDGMTDAHDRDFAKAKILFTCDDGVTVRIWKNSIGIDHVFVACPNGQCLYGGFVGWLHAEELRRTLESLQEGVRSEE